MAKKKAASAVSTEKSKTATPAAADNAANDQAQEATPQVPKIPHIPPAAAEVLGQITWLMLNSKEHRHVFLADYEWLILPAVLRKQFRLIRENEKAVAVVLWAYLNEEAEQRMLSGVRKLAPNEWASKDGTPWVFDVIAPFGGHEHAIQGVIDSAFAGREVKVLAIDSETKGLVARTITGKSQAAE